MRILRVAQNLYPEVPGGGTYHVHAMSRDQAEMGHDVTVLTITDDNSKPRREERNGYTVIRQTPTVEFLGNEISGGVVKFLAHADDYDVIHAHSHIYFSTNMAAIKRYLGETPLAITNHGLYSQTAPEWVFDVYLRTIGRWTFDSADVVFCYTERDRARMRELGVSTAIEVVANGIDQTRFTPDGPESKLIDADGPVVLFVGRLVEGKRPGDVIEALAEIQMDHPDAELWFCGDGPLQEELKQRARKQGIESSVTFLGHVQYDEMPRLYRSSDLLVLPSRAEGLPRTVLEALASEVPVIASNLKQIAPIVEQSGIIVPVGDVSAYAGAISSLLFDPATSQRLGEAGRKLVEHKFRWEKTVNETTTHLDRLIDSEKS